LDKCDLKAALTHHRFSPLSKRPCPLAPPRRASGPFAACSHALDPGARREMQKRDADDQANQRPAHRPKKRSVSNENDVTDSFKGRPHSGTVAEALRPLRKHRPDIHARVLAGEISAHAGMIEAGFRKKTVRKKLTAFKRVVKLLPKLSAAERERVHSLTCRRK